MTMSFFSKQAFDEDNDSNSDNAAGTNNKQENQVFNNTTSANMAESAPPQNINTPTAALPIPMQPPITPQPTINNQNNNQPTNIPPNVNVNPNPNQNQNQNPKQTPNNNPAPIINNNTNNPIVNNAPNTTNISINQLQHTLSQQSQHHQPQPQSNNVTTQPQQKQQQQQQPQQASNTTSSSSVATTQSNTNTNTNAINTNTNMNTNTKSTTTPIINTTQSVQPSKPSQSTTVTTNVQYQQSSQPQTQTQSTQPQQTQSQAQSTPIQHQNQQIQQIQQIPATQAIQAIHSQNHNQSQQIQSNYNSNNRMTATTTSTSTSYQQQPNPNDKDSRRLKHRGGRNVSTPSHKLLALHHKPLDELTDSDIRKYLSDVPSELLIDCLVEQCIKDESLFLGVDNYALKDPTKIRIFIRGLNYDTTKETLAKAFERFGTVIDSTVIYDKSNNRSKGNYPLSLSSVFFFILSFFSIFNFLFFCANLRILVIFYLLGFFNVLFHFFVLRFSLFFKNLAKFFFLWMATD